MYKFNLNHAVYIKQTSDEEVDFKKLEPFSGFTKVKMT